MDWMTNQSSGNYSTNQAELFDEQEGTIRRISGDYPTRSRRPSSNSSPWFVEQFPLVRRIVPEIGELFDESGGKFISELFDEGH